MNDDVVKLLVEANSIQDPEDLRLPQSEVDARCDAIVTRRLTMTSTPTRIASHATEPPPHRRRAMAWSFAAGFVVILLVVGAATLLLRGDNSRVADEPAPPTTVADEPEVAATAATDGRALVTVVAGWQRIGDPWLELEPGSMEPLPGGDFVAASTFDHPEGSRLMWSPDGLNWFDGDPQRLLPHQGLEMAVVGDQVILLEEDTPTLWIGNPKTGNWEPMMDLDTSGLEGQVDPWRIEISAGTDAILATEGVVEGSTVVWLVDPQERAATRTILPVGGADAVWYDGRWHLMHISGPEDWWWTDIALWSSSDGTVWTEDELELPEGWRLPALNFVTAGSSGVVTCAAVFDEQAYDKTAWIEYGHEETAGTWFSPNGVDWQLVDQGLFCRGVYSDTLGFVLEGQNGFALLSPDGTTLEELDSPFPADTVAASGSNLIVHAYRGDEFSASESRGVKGLWLYHQPDE